MKKKFSTVIGIFIFMCVLGSFFITLSNNDKVRAILNLDSTDSEQTYDLSDSDYEIQLDVNSQLNIVSSTDASNKLLTIACGINVSDTDISIKKSPLYASCYPSEPQYVERFRNAKIENKATFVPVLMYHYFYDAEKVTDTKITKNNNYHSIQSLRQQLKWLYSNGYVTLTMDELYAWMQKEIELPEKCVLLTSDDGKENFYTLLQPELKKYGFVATSFVITSAQKNTDKKLLMTNIEMHSHTDNMHKGSVATGGYPKKWGIIQGIAVDKGVEDMMLSSKKLGGSKYMAYPYGNYGGNAQKILKQAGYRMAFTTTIGKVKRDMDLLALPRVRVCGSVNELGFSYLVGDNLHKNKKKK